MWFRGSSISKILENCYDHFEFTKFRLFQRNLCKKEKEALNLSILQNLSEDGNCDVPT